MVKTFLEVVRDDQFRRFVEERLSKVTSNTSYKAINNSFPKLYRYCNVSSYVIDGIVNKQLNFSLVRTFNDLYDCTIHAPCNHEMSDLEIEYSKALTKYVNPDFHQYMRKYLDEHVDAREKANERRKFNLLSYLNTYCCCLSSDEKSILMWSHYSYNSQGICLEYDFNLLSETDLLRKMLFPVLYSSEPLILDDLFSTEACANYPLAFDAGCLCATITKSDVWQYEKEWRLIYHADFSECPDQHIPLSSSIFPTRIILGFHFLRNFFYEDRNDLRKIEIITEKIKSLVTLLVFLRDNHISVAQVTPKIGSYELVIKEFPIQVLIDFCNSHFKSNYPLDSRYYNTLRYRLLKEIDSFH